MPLPYSYDLRTKVVEAIERGMKKTEASQVFNLSRNTINLWLKRQAATGDYRNLVGYQKGSNHKIVDWERLRLFAQTYSDKTQFFDGGGFERTN